MGSRKCRPPCSLRKDEHQYLLIIFFHLCRAFAAGYSYMEKLCKIFSLNIIMTWIWIIFVFLIS